MTATKQSAALRAYRVALRLLPATLRQKHGDDMTALLARDLDRARSRGRVVALAAFASAIWDVARRAGYEHTRPATPGASVPITPLTARQLLRRHVWPFLAAFTSMTGALVALFAARAVPGLLARGASEQDAWQLALLSIPFVSVITLPMSVLVAVLWVFARLSRELRAAGRPTATLRAPSTLLPILIAATMASAVTLGVASELVPRTNARLATLIAGRPVPRGDRSMTIGELRRTRRDLPTTNSWRDREWSAALETEIHKKYALGASCLVLALVGAIAGSRVRGGIVQTTALGVVILGLYYLELMLGESLAERLVVSPRLAMWAANLTLLMAAMLLRARLTSDHRAPAR